MKNNNPIQTIGVVGGGQLALMLAKAAKERRVDLFVQTGSSTDPAVSHATGLVLSDTADINGTSQLANQCGCLIFENEWIDVKALSLLEEDGALFQPSLKAIAPLIDKISQRKLLNDLHIPGPEWIPLSNLKLTDLRLPDGWSFPLMAKSGRGGYDGKGTRAINDYKELNKLISSVDSNNWLLEKWVTYQKELALVLSRDTSGHINSFPLTETFQYKQVCDWTIAPSNVSHSVEAMAINIGSSLLRELNYIGVLTIEFFYGDEGLLVNEIAPRTHNSGHYTIDTCTSSQFDQQVCIASGLFTPPVELKVPGALMINLLGLPPDQISLEERLAKLKRVSRAKLHWYLKEEAMPGRKLGHLTVPLMANDHNKRKEEAKKLLKQIRTIWPMYVPDIH